MAQSQRGTGRQRTSGGVRETRLLSHMTPQIRGNSLSVTIDRDFLLDVGIDVAAGDDPDELSQEYIKRGEREGIVIIDLQEAADALD